MPAQPSAGSLILVDVQVIDHHVQHTMGIGSHHLIHEPQEIYRRTPVADVRHHLTGGDFQSRDSVSACRDGRIHWSNFAASWHAGQQRLRSIQGLNTGLLVRTQNQRVLRRIQI